LSTKARAKVIKDPSQLTYRYRLYIPYDEVAQGLKAGHDVFLEGIKRQTASKAAVKLSRLLNEQVFAIPSIMGKDRKGYAFTTRRRLEAAMATR